MPVNAGPLSGRVDRRGPSGASHIAAGSAAAVCPFDRPEQITPEFLDDLGIGHAQTFPQLTGVGGILPFVEQMLQFPRIKAQASYHGFGNGCFLTTWGLFPRSLILWCFIHDQPHP